MVLCYVLFTCNGIVFCAVYMSLYCVMCFVHVTVLCFVLCTCNGIVFCAVYMSWYCVMCFLHVTVLCFFVVYKALVASGNSLSSHMGKKKWVAPFSYRITVQNRTHVGTKSG
jgi:hypothetical protein